MNIQNLGYCALALCIFTDYTPDQAFDYLETGAARKTFSETNIQDIINLKKSMSYADIGKIYSLSAGAVYRKIKRYKEKKERLKKIS